MYDAARQWVVDRDAVRGMFKGFATTFPSVMDDYVAGEQQEDALAYTRDLNEDNITGLIDLLGEHHRDREAVEEAKSVYTTLLDDFAANDLNAELSVKPTQLGFDVADEETGYQVCANHVADLAETATAQDQRLWIDMEDTAYTDPTLDLYQELLDDRYNVGVCIQAYLQRSSEDIETMPDDAAIRLVKGAYDRDSDFAEREGIDENYERLLEQLFDSDKHVAVATHDTELLERSQELLAETGKDPQDVEFQFLMGVRPELARTLAKNHAVSEYVPFGDEAFDYFWRRVQEHPKYLEDTIKHTARNTLTKIRP